MMAMIRLGRGRCGFLLDDGHPGMWVCLMDGCHPYVAEFIHKLCLYDWLVVGEVGDTGTGFLCAIWSCWCHQKDEQSILEHFDLIMDKNYYHVS